jgi:hypothetical protein
MAHAKLSPSGAHRWMRCPGSVVLEAQYPDESSSYAREGTAAHELAALVLEDNDADAQSYVGKRIAYNDHGEDVVWPITQDMADYVDDYVKLVRERAEGATLLVERKLPIDHITGEEGATGTSDVVIIDHVNAEIVVIDLKYGMGVRVSAEENEQTQLYALGALEEYSVLGEFQYVSMIIHQPRLNHVSEWTITVEQLLQFADEAAVAAERCQFATRHAVMMDHVSGDSRDVAARVFHELLTPGEKQCRFCKAKATCPALRAEITDVVGGSSAATLDEFAEFTPETVDMQTGDNYLPIAMAKVGMVEDWCKAVRAEVERRLLAGQRVDGYKLVEGKRGPRKWADPADTEALFKSFRLRQDEMYDFSLISPTKAEKVFKENPKRWAKVKDLITQSTGKASVAPATDTRQAIAVQSVADDFRDLTQPEN